MRKTVKELQEKNVKIEQLVDNKNLEIEKVKIS